MLREYMNGDAFQTLSYTPVPNFTSSDPFVL